MHRSKILSLLVVMLVATLAFAASPPKPMMKATAATGSLEGVSISSVVQGTSASGPVTIKFTGLAAHSRNGQVVIFTTKRLNSVPATQTALGQLKATSGSFSATLDTSRESSGTLSSPTFPAVHRQNFFLKITGDAVGTLVADSPITVSATIQSSPPTATYQSDSGAVVKFYREGDPNKQTVLAVTSVTSDVAPAQSQTVNITSHVTATVGGTTANVDFTGSATNVASGTNVLFIRKTLTAVNPGPMGPTTISLDSRNASSGTLGSNTFPTSHTQSFFLQIDSQNLGTLVADAPVIMTATIRACPPTATYKSASQPVVFYRQGDPSKQPVLTVQSVSSDVTPGGTGTGN